MGVIRCERGTEDFEGETRRVSFENRKGDKK